MRALTEILKESDFERYSSICDSFDMLGVAREEDIAWLIMKVGQMFWSLHPNYLMAEEEGISEEEDDEKT